MFQNIDLNKITNSLIYILVAVIFYFVFTGIISLFLQKPRERLGEKISARQAKHMSTLQAMLNSAVKYIVIIGLILALLANFGVDISSLLAGLGIATAIIGLAFQDLAKDIIAGVGIITEKQYEVGDLVEVDGFKGRVTSVSLKNTKIKNYRGKELVISNRKMDAVINYSTHNTLAEIDIPVSYNADPDQVETILAKICEDLRTKNHLDEIVGDVNYLGPVRIEESAIIWRITAECAPYQHFAPQRLIRRLVITEFKKSNIKIPYQQLEIHNGK